jgi:hypothetical protein
MTPNGFAYLVLGLWPLIAIGLFRWLPAGRALLICLFLSYLFLPPYPTSFDLPLLPPLDKDSLPALTLLLTGMIFCRNQLRLLPRSKALAALVLVFLLSPLLTVLSNSDTLLQGRIGLPGLGLRDAISLVFNRTMMIVPMLMAYSLLQKETDRRDTLLAFCLFGLLYSVPMLVEVRLSPQLNNWIYGFFQHAFDQAIRFGGYRPVVFLYHGLWVAFFAMTAAVAAAILTRTHTGTDRARAVLCLIYLFGILLLCKSVGALLYAMLLMPMVLFLPMRSQIWIALGFASLAIAYPLIKGAGLLPEPELLKLIARLSEERANSLAFRLSNETLLLERALERPLFGWGSWGRNLIIDPVTGQELSIADGRWVLTLGVYGWLGFAAEMSLLAAPIVLLWHSSHRQAQRKVSVYAGGLALLLGVNMLDLLPNATLTPLTWLLAGVLLSHVEALRHTTVDLAHAHATPSPIRKAKGLRSIM